MPTAEWTPRAVLRTVLVIVAVAAILYVLYLLRRPLSWIVLALFLAVAMAGPVSWLSRRMPRGAAIGVSYLGLLLVPVLIGLIVVPPVVRGGSDLAREAPRYAADVRSFVQDNPTLRRLEQDYEVGTKLEEEARKLPDRVGDAASALGTVGVGLVNSVFAAVTILVLSVFMLGSGPRWVAGAVSLQPPERARRLAPMMERMADAVGKYVAGAVIQATVAGLTTLIVLLILGVPYAAPLAVLFALFDLLPLVGATIGAVLVGVVTIFSDFPTATIIWVIWAVIYQQIENTVIQPQIQKRAVDIHPFVVLVSVLFGSALFGIAGALLAIPVAASVQIAVLEWWSYRHPSAPPPSPEPEPQPA